MRDYGFLSKNFLLDCIGATIENERSKVMNQQEFIEALLKASEDIKALVEQILEASQQQIECQQERSCTSHTTP